MTSAFTPFSTVDPGWIHSDIGYHVHKGRVYLSGLLSSGSGTAGQTLLTVPPAIRPPHSVSFTLVATGADTRDSAVVLPLTYAATLSVDGVLRLDNPPPAQINTTPSAAAYYYIDIDGTHFPRYTAPMHLSIFLGAASWTLAVEADTYSATPLTGLSDFSNIDGGYSPHGSRVHLAGSLHAASDGAQEIVASMPPGAITDLDPAVSYDTVVHHSGNPFVAHISGGELALEVDAPIKPAGEPPPVAWFCPPSQGYHTGMGFFGQNFTSALQTIPSELEGVELVDHGKYLCGGSECWAPGSIPDLTLDLPALLATVDPAPDWFYLRMLVGISVTNLAQSGCVGGDCGPFITLDRSFTISAGTPTTWIAPDGSILPLITGPTGYLSPASPLYSGDTHLTDFGITPGGLDMPRPEMLWQWGQITTSVTFSFPGTLNKGSAQVQFILIPLYERRQNGLHAGDTLDLTGAGWPGVAAAAVVPELRDGQIAPGPGAVGHVRLG